MIGSSIRVKTLQSLHANAKSGKDEGPIFSSPTIFAESESGVGVGNTVRLINHQRGRHEMLMRQVSSKSKVSNGVLRAAMVTGVVSGVAAASLSGAGPVSATCIGISGINIGNGCNSTLGTFALGLGPGTLADASGGFLNGAIAIGTNVAAFAEGSGFSVANLAVNVGSADTAINPATGIPTPGTAYSRVTAGAGFLNLGLNLGGAANAGGGDGPRPIDISASGVGSSVINAIGANRNTLRSQGLLANTTVIGTLFPGPNGSDNTVTSTGPLSVAFVRQGIFSEPLDLCDPSCGNTVTSGPFSIAGAFNTVKRIVEQNGFGINIATPFNDVGTTTNLSVMSRQQDDSGVNPTLGSPRNPVRSSLNAVFDRPKATSSTGSSRTSLNDRINTSVNRFRESVKNVTRKLAEGPKAEKETA
jgi:hypothetical protein